MVRIKLRNIFRSNIFWGETFSGEASLRKISQAIFSGKEQNWKTWETFAGAPKWRIVGWNGRFNSHKARMFPEPVIYTSRKLFWTRKSIFWTESHFNFAFNCKEMFPIIPPTHVLCKYKYTRIRVIRSLVFPIKSWCKSPNSPCTIFSHITGYNLKQVESAIKSDKKSNEIGWKVNEVRRNIQEIRWKGEEIGWNS